MKPLGRFFQVSFIIKSEESAVEILKKIQDNANKTYSIKAIVEKYMACIEEIINIPLLTARFEDAIKQGYLNQILDEIVLQSKVEFNYEEEAEGNCCHY
jgi:hypothetical protein